ncbi:MAG: bis(5'-nucleosyl)-tetraphosphatase (symmetrical) YqeK [Oscillospiraceae bacterium]|nr:bis(5'-nucleosyl)-tetraphosphatase (symmetrical) YqeK [Oscillospiraceae bacterium]
MDYRELIRPRMSEYRFVHSCAVADRAKHLAEVWGADPKKAFVAGMVHDICKDMPKDDQLKYINENGIISDDVLLSNPSLWHSAAGSVFLPSVGVNDPEILSAVRYHTSARADMTLLEEIIYMADLTSADRVYDDVDYVRSLCEESLHKATLYALAYIVGDLAKQNRPISRDTWEAYNFYLNLCKEL